MWKEVLHALYGLLWIVIAMGCLVGLLSVALWILG